MRVSLMAVGVLVTLLGACDFEEHCSGAFYFDDKDYICRACPKNATFEGGSCQCNDRNYEFVNHTCKLKAGVTPETEADAGSGTGAEPGKVSCTDYCGFMKVCLADNSLAGVLGDIVTGLHADDAAACKSSCMTDTGGDGTSSAVVSCIAQGQDTCEGEAGQAGLMATFGVIGECCGTRKSDLLCKAICRPLKASPLTSSMVTFCE